MRDTLELWFLADALLDSCKTSRLSPRLDGGGITYTSHAEWAMQLRSYATDAEYKIMTATIKGYRVAGLKQAIRSFRRRVPGDIIETGYYLLDR